MLLIVNGNGDFVNNIAPLLPPADVTDGRQDVTEWNPLHAVIRQDTIIDSCIIISRGVYRGDERVGLMFEEKRSANEHGDFIIFWYSCFLR